MEKEGGKAKVSERQARHPMQHLTPLNRLSLTTPTWRKEGEES